MKKICAFAITCLFVTSVLHAQDKGAENRDAKLTEVWSPEPSVVTPGTTSTDAPSDAIVLFNGKDFSNWQPSSHKGNVGWKLDNNAMTVAGGGIETKQSFGDCQLHIEWRTPSVVKGNGQERGNSGIFFMGRYELQVLDSYKNRTYSNGQAGSVYKQLIPLVNPSRPPGEWQTYDITLVGRMVTVVANGKTIICNQEIPGITGGALDSKEDEPGPIYFQGDHGPIDLRNIAITPAK